MQVIHRASFVRPDTVPASKHAAENGRSLSHVSTTVFDPHDNFLLCLLPQRMTIVTSPANFYKRGARQGDGGRLRRIIPGGSVGSPRIYRFNPNQNTHTPATAAGPPPRSRSRLPPAGSPPSRPRCTRAPARTSAGPRPRPPSPGRKAQGATPAPPSLPQRHQGTPGGGGSPSTRRGGPQEY